MPVPIALTTLLFGSFGLTLIVCEKSGRRGRLIELDPKYVDVTVRRWQDWSGKQTILAADNLVFDVLATHDR